MTNRTRHTLTLQTAADQINRDLRLAMTHAEKAVDYARRAGERLLSVKKELPHGSFEDWLRDNVGVSKRQAQRYMRAAQGKPLADRTVLASKNDTVSLSPEWMPEQSGLAVAKVENGELLVLVQESAQNPGFFLFLVLNGCACDYTLRGIRRDHLERAVIGLLPHRISGGCSLTGLPWEYTSAPPDYLSRFVRDVVGVER